MAAPAAGAFSSRTDQVIGSSSALVHPFTSCLTRSHKNKKSTRYHHSCTVRAGIHVDRKRYLEESLKRQQELEARQAEAEISCPVDCVTVVNNKQDFDRILSNAQRDNDLVVVDFYNTSCGACKYMLPQFIKLCKRGCHSEECKAEEGEEDEQQRIVFVKHNVLDDYDEVTDLAEFYSVTSVPLFAIFKNACLVERFATRDKQRLEKAICQLLENST